MTGDKQKTKGKPYLKRFLAILLVLVVLIPSSVSLILVFQMISLKQDIVTLQTQLLAWQAEADERMFSIEKQVQEKQVQSAEQEATVIYNDKVVEIEEEAATADIELIENQIVWEDVKQGARAWNSDAGIRKVYLTFDDGPSENTNKILDILDEYGVKATFFVVGKEGYTEEYQRIVKEGHSLGMHSFSHKYREIYQSVDAYGEDMNKLHDFLYEVTGEVCKIARFPGGSSNTISKVDMQELIAYLTEQGITYYDWNVSSGDASSSFVSASQIENNVLNNVWKYDSVMILMHDSSAKDTTVEALPNIIEKILESENTVLLPISEDTIPIQHIEVECQ